MVRRNLEGLLSKAYKYGELMGVELGMYIDYPEKEEFVWYESQGFSCHGQVEAKVRPFPIQYAVLTSSRRRIRSLDGTCLTM